jgi:hypothetical protein
MGLTIPPPQNDILFVDMANYKWGILDEIATTAFYVGKYHMGLAACEKLLSEPYLPEEHRPRVENNKNTYIKVIADIQAQMNAQQAQNLVNMKKVEIPEPKTTLKIDPKNLTVKL